MLDDEPLDEIEQALVRTLAKIIAENVGVRRLLTETEETEKPVGNVNPSTSGKTK